MNKRGKSKKADSRFKTDKSFRILPVSKRSQEVFGISFGVIFSIILIVFILVVAGIAINYFLGMKKCTQLGLFIKDIQKDVDTAWNSDKYLDETSYDLPSNLDYVCFANLSNPVKGGDLEKEVYSEITVYEFSSGNMFFYPLKSSCDIPNINVKHINIQEITKLKNPYCIPVEDGKIAIKTEMGFNEGLVTLS